VSEPGEVSDPGEEALLRSPRSSRRARLARHVFLAAVLLALALLLWQQREEVVLALRSTSAGAVALALVLAMTGAVIPGLVWRDLLVDQGQRVPVLAGLRVFFLAQLGKYLPGGIWNLVAQVDLARDLEIPPRRSATATVLALVLSVVCAVLVAAAVLPFALPGLVDRYWWVFLAVPVLAVLLLPRSVAWWSRLAMRVLRRTGEPFTPTWRVMGRSTVLLLVSWVALGLHFAVLVQDLSDGTEQTWLLGIGAFALAWVAGFLVVVAPAGAGVREAALVLGFAAVLPAGAVLVVAVLSRLLLVVADVLLAAAFAVVVRVTR
jgi:uncharacterized membrane protein YbhN (UPF0104 family)